MKAVLQEVNTYSCERTMKEYVHGLFTTEVEKNRDCRWLILDHMALTKIKCNPNVIHSAMYPTWDT